MSIFPKLTQEQLDDLSVEAYDERTAVEARRVASDYGWGYVRGTLEGWLRGRLGKLKELEAREAELMDADLVTGSQAARERSKAVYNATSPLQVRISELEQERNNYRMAAQTSIATNEAWRVENVRLQEELQGERNANRSVVSQLNRITEQHRQQMRTILEYQEREAQMRTILARGEQIARLVSRDKTEPAPQRKPDVAKPVEGRYSFNTPRPAAVCSLGSACRVCYP